MLKLASFGAGAVATVVVAVVLWFARERVWLDERGLTVRGWGPAKHFAYRDVMSVVHRRDGQVEHATTLWVVDIELRYGEREQLETAHNCETDPLGDQLTQMILRQVARARDREA